MHGGEMYLVVDRRYVTVRNNNNPTNPHTATGRP